MQNKPNPKNTQTNSSLYPKKIYEDYHLPGNEENKPNSNPIQTNPQSAPRCHLPSPRPPKSSFCAPPAIETTIPTTSGFRNFALCILHFEFSLLTLSPKSAQISVSAHKLGAKTSKNHNSFAQNKPNLQNKETNLTPCPKKVYKDFPLPGTQKNKPNSNPFKPNPASPRPSSLVPHPSSSAPPPSIFPSRK